MIYIAPLSAVGKIIAQNKPSHLISVLEPESMIPTPPEIAQARHLRLGFGDPARATGGRAPAPDHAARLLAFIDAWNETREGPLLIHCQAGVSRSTAAAFIALCRLNPDSAESEMAALLRRSAPHAAPDLRLVSLADAEMKRAGAMNAAILSLPPPAPIWEERVAVLPCRTQNEKQ